MEILNIDNLVTSSRVLKYKGSTYAVEDPTVQEFIDNLKTAESLESEAAAAAASSAEVTVLQSFEGAVKTVKKHVPSMPEDLIRGFRLVQLSAVLQFIRGEVDIAHKDAVTSDAPAVGAGEVTEKKPD